MPYRAATECDANRFNIFKYNVKYICTNIQSIPNIKLGEKAWWGI